jgi:hypothetical protein|tara:strand:+ start:223 stop:561 length:339 start_codon:yes stop_codon:yes gene_type:complete
MSQVNSHTNLFTFIQEGIEPGTWGYGIRRVTIKHEIPQKIPYTFTSAGFKDKNGNWWTCLRMNVDQHIPEKKHPFPIEQRTNDAFKESCSYMMDAFVEEYIQKHQKHQHQRH